LGKTLLIRRQSDCESGAGAAGAFQPAAPNPAAACAGRFFHFPRHDRLLLITRGLNKRGPETAYNCVGKHGQKPATRKTLIPRHAACGRRAPGAGGKRALFSPSISFYAACAADTYTQNQFSKIPTHPPTSSPPTRTRRCRRIR
jgi:hypothetical protein